ncbi:beta-galactoside alpha-2,6-sialyltransferase 2 [Cydia splendana]|uniref:beta-galactoside alpha-2,6-sialyltransferase 2 n=1 Tax=Cydia splendana TaxID=1100963 RepID=UPI00300CBE0B
MKVITLIVVLIISLIVIIGYVNIHIINFWTSSNHTPVNISSLSNRGVQIVSTTALNVPSNKLNADKKRRSAVAPYKRNNIAKDTGQNRSTAPTNVIRKIEGSPRFPNIHDVVLELDSTKYFCNDSESAECATLTSILGESIQKELTRVLTYDSNVFRSGVAKLNTYHVQFNGSYGQLRSRDELVCALGGVRVRTVTGQETPLAQHGLAAPPDPLQRGRRYSKCAVVSSAGALLGSRLGRFIDSHDMVVRFNNAPTENYTEDVGSKTTFRIVNSQVVAKTEYNFLEDPLYCNISILIWDPANYSSNLDDWYRSPDYPLFLVYKRFLELNPDADVHILNPQVLWEIWTLLQRSAPSRIRKNPPSSGFIGIWFALHRCANVRVFEYVPSSRATTRCHYYSAHKDRHCTLGSWHPLAQEKILANLMRNNSDFDTYQRGFINIPGVESFDCPD